MSRAAIRPLLYGALFLAFLLHNDLWLWNDARLVLGLPVGLVYHIGFCVGVALLMALVAATMPLLSAPIDPVSSTRKQMSTLALTVLVKEPSD